MTGRPSPADPAAALTLVGDAGATCEGGVCAVPQPPAEADEA